VPDPISLQRIDATTGARPFLKWPGGKRWLVRRGINVPVMAPDATYFEPFVGAGSIYFALQPANAVLGDINPHLIATYRALRVQPRAVIRELSTMSKDLDTYEQMRKASPTKQFDRAIRLLYLNRTAFAGLYRVNQKNEFNVPYGHYTDRLLCQPDTLLQASASLQLAQCRRQTFETVSNEARAGDLVYLDPPYTLNESGGFGRYNEHLFTWRMQIELADLAHELRHRGVHVLASNSSDPSIALLYAGFNIVTVKRHSNLSRDPLRRGVACESLFASYIGVID
jgi:DNA adenine methylase